MPNPLVPQGTLNRLRASLTFSDYPGLNVTASYLGREGISLAFLGDVTTPLPTMSGVVQSPEPYQQVNISIHLIKSQALANSFKTQLEASSLLGDLTVRPDTVTLSPFQLSNVAVNNVNPLKFDGTDPGYVVLLSGIYYINDNLWNV